MKGPVFPVAIILGLLPGPVFPTSDSDFETSLRQKIEKDNLRVTKQLERGSIELVPDPAGGSGLVVRVTAGPREETVGKAGLIYAFSAVGPGRTITARAQIYIPSGSYLDSVILMDLECKFCGMEKNPGIRLYLRDGRFRVDRWKIYIDEPFYPTDPRQVTVDQWHDVEWRTTLGTAAAGRTTVLLDGDVVLEALGTTVLTRGQVASYEREAATRVVEAVDRLQIGITANSNDDETTLYFRNFGLQIH